MLSYEIRQRFLRYFVGKGHLRLPSSPVIPHDDPTLLFTNAGMNQFKDLFCGKSQRDYTRATTSQKCIRVGGKHNDLENVGHTSRHLTFFEMLGNFSFGDYFKAGAIEYAWEVTGEVFGYDLERVWATVFYEDEEAFELWKKYLPEERIVRMGEKDNFWAMGDTGPCGPCSELYLDRGVSYGQARNPAEDISGERFIEFWNLVFMQHNRSPSGEMTPLPKPSIDTGAGLERVVALKLGVSSLFGTDILRSLIAEVENLSGHVYAEDSPLAPAFHVIADHTRSLAFAIADGAQPSNLDRGYVLRKLIRRAVRYGRQLTLHKPFLSKIVPRLLESMGEDFPELLSAQGKICSLLEAEEEGFLRTLRQGGNLLTQIVASSTPSGRISGEDAFRLKDTYGLPLEEILLWAKDAGLTVDICRFEALEQEAKARSREARKRTKGEGASYDTVAADHPPTHFLGYQEYSSESLVLGLFREGKAVSALYEGEEGVVLLDQTPFYPERGGQVGDQGSLFNEQNLFTVLDCQTVGKESIGHHGLLQKGELHVGMALTATVAVERRRAIANNHTATHLLHWALQQVVGSSIRQAGSYVEATRLRFDFSHTQPLSTEQLYAIEDLVNAKIRENGTVHTYELSYEEAATRPDILQFFGEKYGSRVRVVDIDFSKELCGGTHTSQIGTIGTFRILKESSIAAGVRRIEAVTGAEAERYARTTQETLEGIARLLQAPTGQVTKRIEALLHEQKAAAAALQAVKEKRIAEEGAALLKSLSVVGGVSVIAASLPLDRESLSLCADWILQQTPKLLLLLFGVGGEECTILIRVGDAYVQKGLSAQELLTLVLPPLKGKGGGNPPRAQGKGTAPEGIPEAIEKVRAWLAQKHF